MTTRSVDKWLSVCAAVAGVERSCTQLNALKSTLIALAITLIATAILELIALTITLIAQTIKGGQPAEGGGAAPHGLGRQADRTT